MKSTILIVSSDNDTLSIAQSALSEDYQLHIATSGCHGIQLFEANLLQIQMVILDTSLVDMLAQDWLKQLAPHMIPYTILIAADDIPDWMVESMKAGAMDIVRKEPLYDVELALAVRQGFDYARSMQYLTRCLEHVQNQTIQSRLNSFLELMKLRKSQGVSVTPNEIALFFPSKDREPELPLGKIIEVIHTGDAHTLMTATNERPKLLIVEDEDPVRELLYLQFRRECEVFVANSCEDALAILSTKNNIDIAILDIGLPNMSGDDLVPILKQKYPNIQIVMLTGYSEHRLIVKTFTHGARDYIVKPYDDDNLRQRVFGLLQSSLINRTLATYMKIER